MEWYSLLTLGECVMPRVRGDSRFLCVGVPQPPRERRRERVLTSFSLKTGTEGCVFCFVPPSLRTLCDAHVEEVMTESPQNMPSVPPHTKVLFFKALHRKCQILVSSLTWGKTKVPLNPRTLQREVSTDYKATAWLTQLLLGFFVSHFGLGCFSHRSHCCPPCPA